VELQSRLAGLQKQGIAVVAVSYDPVETLATFAAMKGITFPLLSDQGSHVIRKYRLFNDAVEKDTRNYGIPWPGTFMLDSQRRVTTRYFEDRYQERNTAASIVVREGGNGAGPTLTAANPHMSLKAFVSDEAVAPGSRVTLAFDVTPGRRMHVYAPGADYQVITIAIDPQPVLTAHETQYPPSEIYFFEPLNEKVPVYQKPFRLTRDVTIAATREAQQALREMERLTLSGKIEYQACDDKVCFKPNSIPFTFDLKLKPLERP
jgi:hypothetical protein